MRWVRAVGASGTIACACAVALATGAASASAQVPGLPWTELLPALPSAPQTHPNRVAHCKRPRLRCVRVQIRRMRELRARLGCDHKGVFATTYLELTKQARDALAADPDLLRWPKFFFREDALFANVYFRTVRRWERGEEVPAAWRIAFETAERRSVTGAQDMLLGINAHVQNDMPFVLARLGLRDRAGNSRKPDHDLFNRVLAAGYERVVSAVRDRYDASVGLTNPPGVPADDVAGLEIVRLWREHVWRSAERLVNAPTAQAREAVAQQIESYAAAWAEGIAAVQCAGLARPPRFLLRRAARRLSEGLPYGTTWCSSWGDACSACSANGRRARTI